jgi:hypothetical protein
MINVEALSQNTKSYFSLFRIESFSKQMLLNVIHFCSINSLKKSEFGLTLKKVFAFHSFRRPYISSVSMSTFFTTAYVEWKTGLSECGLSERTNENMNTGSDKDFCLLSSFRKLQCLEGN